MKYSTFTTCHRPSTYYITRTANTRVLHAVFNKVATASLEDILSTQWYMWVHSACKQVVGGLAATINKICKKLTVFYNMMFDTRLCDVIMDPFPLVMFIKHMESLNCHMLRNVLTVSGLCPIPKCIAVNFEQCTSHEECLNFSCRHLHVCYIVIWALSCFHQLWYS